MIYNDKIEFDCTCESISIYKWEKLMYKCLRADKRKINNMVRKQIPYLYNMLSLNIYNPYEYYKTNTHYILVHSSIEYFLRRY